MANAKLHLYEWQRCILNIRLSSDFELLEANCTFNKAFRLDGNALSMQKYRICLCSNIKYQVNTSMTKYILFFKHVFLHAKLMRNSKGKRYSENVQFLCDSETHYNNSGALHAAVYETCLAVVDKNAQKAFTVIPNSSYLLCHVYKLSLPQDL